MNNKRSTPIKIRRLNIKNYKGIDELELEFPVPRMVDDHDIFVMGSRNGLGKTSILECCSLLLLAITLPEERFKLRDRYLTVDVPDLLINADAKSAEIEGDVVVGDESISLSIRIDRNGIVKVSGESLHEKRIENDLFDHESETDDFVKAICGFSPNPVIQSTFLFFHSYRKVQEGNPELAMMVDRGRVTRRGMYPRQELPMSAFKLRILRSLMGQANLFEFVDNQESDEVIMQLNELVARYAGGTISKLRSSADNTVDFRVKPTKGGDSFTFDGLSSGQKEIISTLFLIWYHTRNSPSVVFIDEPEMHLNSQWHRSFVKQLMRLSPQNQYILATHSEDIMDSVPEDRRLLLVGDKEVE